MGEAGEREAATRTGVMYLAAGFPVTIAALGASAVELAHGEVRGDRLDLPVEPREHWVQPDLGRVGGEGHGRILESG